MIIKEAKDKKIKDLLNSSGILTIPRFQRPYSWGKDKISILFDDIFENEQDYFIGSLVLYQISDSEKGIIDGQQRLTTITIILCALRDILIGINADDLANGIHDNYIEKKNDQNKKYYKLNTETSYPYLQSYILPINNRDESVKTKDKEEKGIEDAYNICKDIINNKVKELDDYGKVKGLQNIKDRIINLSIVYIELGNEDDAYQIFETLNTRGQDLLLTDRIKNHLFRLIKTDNSQNDPIKERWKQILKILNDGEPSIDPDNFIYHRWNSSHYLTTKAKIFELFKKEVENKEDASKEIDSMLNDVKIYGFINNPDLYDSEKLNKTEIQEKIKALNIMGITLGYPALISILKEYKNDQISFGNICDFLSKMEKFHFIFNTLLSERSSGITNAYIGLANTIKIDKDKNNVLRKFELFKRPFEAESDIMKASFKNIIFTKTESKQRKLVQYILKKYDRSSTQGIKDFSEYTIEHLIPQCLIGKTFLDKDIGQLGNLLFVTKDMQNKLKDKPLKEKVKILQEDGISIPYLDCDRISDDNVQNLKLIENRTNNMFDDINNIWG